MTAQEKRLDSLGQCVFRLETNLCAMQRRLDMTWVENRNLVKDMQEDLEKLKRIKAVMLADIPESEY